MSVRLRDTGTLLEPATKTDPYTSNQVPDWTQAATEHATAVQVQPISSNEAVLTAGTVISRWKAFLPPTWDGTVTPTWRVRWDGNDYDIDGGVERHKTRDRVRFLSVILKLVEG